MIKKYSKLFLFSLMTFFLGLVPAFAREMDFAALGKYVLTQDKNAGNYYVIGEYVYTSTYSNFDIPDIMLAARSIDVQDRSGKINTDSIYGEMTIYYVERVGNTNQWKTPTILTGKKDAALPANLDIKYVNYKEVKDMVNTDTLIETAEQQVSSSFFTINQKEHAITATIKPEKFDEELKPGMGTGAATALVSLLSDPKVASVQLKFDDETYDLTSAKSTTDFAGWFNTTIKGQHNVEKVIDLVGHTISITFTFNNDIVSQNEANTEVYTIEFVVEKEDFPANEKIQAVEEALNTPANLYFNLAFDEETKTITFITLDGQNIIDADGTGLLSNLQTIFTENPAIDKITIAYDADNKKEITRTDVADLPALKLGLKAFLATITPSPVANINDLVLTMTISLDARRVNNPTETYTIQFEQQVAIDSKVENAVSGLNSGYYTGTSTLENTTNKVEIKVEHPALKLTDVSGSNIFVLFETLLTDENVRSMNITYTDVNGKEQTQSFAKETTTDDLYNWFVSNISSIFGDTTLEKLINNDLIGKSFQVELVLADHIVNEENKPTVTYTFTFTGRKLEEIDDETINSYISAYDVTGRNDFSAKLNKETNTIEYKILDREKTIQTVSETGLMKGIVEILAKEEVSSIAVTVNGQSIDFAKAEIKSPEQAKAKTLELIQKLLGIEAGELTTATLGKLYGREFTFVIVLDNQYAMRPDQSIKSNTYTVSFE